jgi:hypothetical protein
LWATRQFLDPPADYPQYRDGYYAFFFADPDGLKREFVHRPQAREAQASVCPL